MKLFWLFLLSAVGLFAQNPSICNVTNKQTTGYVLAAQNASKQCHWIAGTGTGTVMSVQIAGTANQIAATGTCTITVTGTCALSIPSAFVLPGTINGLTITTTTGTFTLTNAKTLTVNNTVTIDATDGSTIVFPNPSGVTSGDCVEITKTGSTLTFVDAGAACGTGGTPGGSTAQVQYNNAGAFGGITGATTNGTTLTLVGPVLGTPASGNASNLTNLPIALTTTGTSGAATYTQSTSTLNIPQYAGPISGATTNAVVTAASATTIQTPNANTTIDPSTGNFSTHGTVSSGVGSGVGGQQSYVNGTAPSAISNAWGWNAPTTITTSWYGQAPNALPTANQIMVFSAPTSNVSPWAWITPTITAGSNVTVAGAWPSWTVAASGGTSGGTVVNKTANYNAASGDSGSVLQFNGSNITYTLLATPPTMPWIVGVCNINTTALTIARNTNTINGGAANISLPQFGCTTIESDTATGANYVANIPVIGSSTITATPSGAALALSIPSSVALPGNPTTTTQAALTNNTTVATTAYTDAAVAAAVAAANPATSVLAASTSSQTGTYSNGVGGVGATFTITATGAYTLDGTSIGTIGQRILLKNQASTFQNGIYTATIVGTTGVSPVFTRALDYDQPSDINNTGAIFVQTGTANILTSWLLTSTVTMVGTDALTYSQSSSNPANLVTAVSPGVGLCHFAGSTQVCTSSAVANADIANSTIDLTAKVTGLLPQANISLLNIPTPGATCTFTAPTTICIATAAATIAVPVPATGQQFCAMNDDNVSTVITLSAIGSSARYENTARTAYGTAGTGTLVSGGAVGDFVCLVGRDSTHYLTFSSKGTWTAN